MDTILVLEILKIAVVNGIPAVQSAIQAFHKDNITIADIKEIQALVKKPESYFK